MSALLIAVQFLTRLPVRLPGMPTPQQLGQSLLWYPLVGVLLGLLLMTAQWLLSNCSPLLQAALLLALWVGLTGGLHLDGLADSADAWSGGYGDRERTLTIMQDPRSGPIAVVVLMLVLLLKFAALTTLLAADQAVALLLAPLLGRTALLALFLTTPYVRPGGLGQALADNVPRATGWRVLLAVAVLLLVLVGGAGWLALSLTVIGFYGLRHMMQLRLGGTTGDTAGAAVEVLECLMLLGLALALD